MPQISGYIFVAGGSNATSAATAHLLFGNYQGMSQLNNETIVNTQIFASAVAVRFGDSNVSNNLGFRIAGTATVELPAMRAGDASQLLMARETATDASINWVYWRQRPY